jgi:8-oxo-dGTP pyrophosphatase MutT (NUDIX family)
VPGHPIPSSTIVVWRDRPAGPEVYLMRRAESASWLAGAHVFPGGRVDADDRDRRWMDAGDDVPPARWLAAFADPREAVAFGVAAVRELFEEVGLLLARREDGSVVETSELAAPAGVERRRSLLARSVVFSATCEAAGWRPARDRLVPLSRWITPESERRRYDTRFFLARLPPGQEPQVDGTEGVDGCWLAPSEALARHADGRITLAPPTVRTLHDLTYWPSFDAGIARLERTPYRTIAPRLFVEAGRTYLLLPGDELYPARAGDALTPPRRFVLAGKRWLLVEGEQ